MRHLLPKYFANSSIKSKLLVLMMLTCGVILLATTTVFVAKESNAIIRQQREDLTSLASIIAKNVASSVTFNDPQSALDTMASLAVKRDIQAAYILHSDATIFSRYIASGITPQSLPFEQPGVSKQTCQEILKSLQLRSNRLVQLSDQVTLVMPIHLDDQPVGTVVLFADMRDLRSRLIGTMVAAVIILSIAAVAAYLIAVQLQQVISEPILELADAMQQVSETKDFSYRVAKPGNDEIGQLYDRFNEMLQEVEERNMVLRQRQEHLQQLAHFDTLTRLPNRVLFYDRLQQAMNLALRTDQVVAVIFLDLDRFKDINDTLGHRTGDLLLQQVADRMALVLRDCDTVARLGGDEFTIFAQNMKSPENVVKIGQKLLDLFEIPYNLDGQQIYITCSIGITIFPQDADTIDTLLMNADIAMYHAKADGKNTYRLFNSDMNKETSERLTLQNDLRQAVSLNQLSLVYQPQFDTCSRQLTGVEALVRWQHPVLGTISPGRFIPLAEESGAIISITEWVLHTACIQAKKWYDAGHTNLPVAVNLSACSLKRHNTTDIVHQTLRVTALPPHLLKLELTESLLIEGDKQAENMLVSLKAMGVSIAIDDFGTGYSSLSYLHRFPIDILKIDRSFIWNMNRSEDDLAIVRAIIAMAHSLHLHVIAEGVEAEEQLAILKTYGCETIQGYLLGKPETADMITERLELRSFLNNTPPC